MLRSIIRVGLAVAIISGLSACSHIERRLENQSPRESYSQMIPSRFEAEAREELGLGRGYLSSGDRAMVQERVYLKDLESRLSSADKAQYYQIRSSLRTDSERIQFLNLRSREAKARWLVGRGLNRQDHHAEDIARTIENKDIALGMSESAVRESWGDPDLIEVAGEAVYGYKRWRYRKMASGNSGYQRELRSVYFEGGRVVGWETQDL